MTFLDHGRIVLAEEDMAEANGLFKKRILYEGKFLHPANPNSFFEVTKEHFSDIVQNFGKKVFDKVQMYWNHDEDPRDVTGEVVGVEVGIDPKDNKNSLYAILKPHDEKAAEKMRTNKIGVSAALDNVYREHLTGEPTGTVLRHVALVGEGWIKKLGEFVPLRLSDSKVFLSEDKAGAVFISNEEDKSKEKPEVKEKVVEKTDLEEDKDKKKTEDKGKEKPMELSEILTELKTKHNIDVAALQEQAKATQTLAAIRAGLNLDDKVKEVDLAETIVKSVTDANVAVTTMQAEAAVAALLTENKITPAQKDAYTKLWLKDKDLFADMTKDLTSGKVPLGEKGKQTNEDPGVDENKEIERATTLLAEAGVEMKGYSNKNGKKEDQ